MLPLKKLLAIACLILGVVFVVGGATLAWSFFFIQPLRLEYRPSGLFLDFRQLGEYQANILRLRLTDEATSRVIWEVLPTRNLIPVWTLDLHLGPNPANPGNWANCRQVVPIDSSSFLLTPGAAYRLEAWSDMNGRESHRTVRFTLR